MEILQTAGKHQILAIMVGLDGETPIELIELAGRTAYQSQDKISEGSAKKFVAMLRDRGHESVIEHSAMTVGFSDVSRGLTHEYVRHRLMSPTEESTRYVDESNLRVVCPPDKDPDDRIARIVLPDGHEINVSFAQWVGLNEQMYRSLRQAEWVPEDARQILPIGIVAQIVVTCNFREWRHIFELRCSKRAHWEIRSVMVSLLADVQSRVPVVFDDFKIDGSVPYAAKTS
ncbi:FAD-dependent thymidylate synthase [Patescibacteria group bacterium]|nr:FAD-dependent thymidylate synthase [Patescibacteria group bacterium]MBU4023384.1 FAD-dependent thymidylate synthase [Patescibacteria group bacterium]MBU4078249.1 FAD-dependent thymidylate synthase [Patescibacteria group bacterium]